MYDLRVRTPALELRVPTEDELVALCQVAKAGVHDPDTTPFEVPWTDKPSPRFEREFLQHFWSTRAQWTPERWMLDLAVFRDGEPAGFQNIGAENFAVLREVQTGSWLGKAFQGQGYGKQMRAGVLHLAFAELGAVAAESGAFIDNPASLAVSRSLGYQDNGRRRRAPRGEPREQQLFRLTRQRWQEHRFCEVEVTGLDSCRDMFGV
ncbi:MAG: GNAT family N-acetyltransferase [Micromonosporaceae bacterium]|nr:GNAT family N-acetyltransferase [Micromonosporaceae bacterium]